MGGSFMINLRTSLKKLIGRNTDMPAYDMEFTIGEYVIRVNPSEFKRFWIGRPMPFYNGTKIRLDVSIQTPRKPINDNLDYEWELVTHKGNKLSQHGKDLIHLSDKDYHAFFPSRNKTKDVDFRANSHNYFFTKLSAIKINPLLDLDTYDLVIKAKDNQQVVCQFTLQDIDDYGKGYHINLWAIVISGMALIISAIAFLENK
jgi:hypothetical protein